MNGTEDQLPGLRLSPYYKNLRIGFESIVFLKILTRIAYFVAVLYADNAMFTDQLKREQLRNSCLGNVEVCDKTNMWQSSKRVLRMGQTQLVFCDGLHYPENLTERRSP